MCMRENRCRGKVTSCSVTVSPSAPLPATRSLLALLCMKLTAGLGYVVQGAKVWRRGGVVVCVW